MTNHEFYRKRVREIAAELPEEVFIISIPTVSGLLEAAGEWKPGLVSGVNRWLGAERIVQGSHRRASEAEIEEYRRLQKQREEQCEAIERQNRRQQSQHFTVAVAEALRQLGPKPDAAV